MFVVHVIRDRKASTTRDYGHVNQFLRSNPGFRPQKGEPVFEECIKQGFIYIQEYMCWRKYRTSYHSSLAKLKAEVYENQMTRQ